MTPSNNEPSSDHFERLGASYLSVGEKTWLNEDFVAQNLESSRRLYTDKSLREGKPQPKDLEVFGLLSGLPFSEHFTQALVRKQQEISVLLEGRMHYWVKPANFGLEYFVFKWPDEVFTRRQIADVAAVLQTISAHPFLFEIKGLQVNPDGCVIAKGFDQSATVARIREHLRTRLTDAPLKQSNWAHVPLGRILQPLGPARFSRLREFFAAHEDTLIASSRIETLKFIHETRWYMERREVLEEYRLS